MDEFKYQDLKKRNFSKTEPDNKMRKRNIQNQEIIGTFSKQFQIRTSDQDPNLRTEQTENSGKDRISEGEEKKLRNLLDEQKNRIQELSTKYKGLEELLNQTEKTKREFGKKVKIHEAKLKQKERHAKKVELVLKKFHAKLKQFPVPKMGFNSRTDLNFLEKQNVKFVSTSHRNQNLLKKQAMLLKIAESKAKTAELTVKEMEQEGMDLRDRMGAHRARADRVEQEILEVRERNQKYSDLIRNLEDKIMGLENEMIKKKKEFLKMKKREMKCSKCSQRSINKLSSKKNLNQIEEESHSSSDNEPVEDDNFVTIEEYNEMKTDKNEWKGRYNELNFKFMKTSQSLKKKDVRVKYLMEKINQLSHRTEKLESQKRKRQSRLSRREGPGSGRQ